MTLTEEQLREALAAHSESVLAWGATVTAMLERVGEQVAELERRVSSLEKRARFANGGIGR